MNDFDYDALQKKRLARNAFAKGSRNRKGCRLPHENLTKEELQKLNGEVRTVGFNDKITWDFFKALPADLQEEYLNHLIDRFGIGLATIGRDLFGFAKSYLGIYVNRHGLRVNVPGHGGRLTSATMENWRRWVSSGTTSAPIVETAATEDDGIAAPVTIAPAEDVKPFRAHDFEDMFKECGMEREEKAEEPSTEPEEIDRPYPLTDMSMTLKGTPIDILTTLRMSFPTLLDKDKTYRFSIKVDDFVV